MMEQAESEHLSTYCNQLLDLLDALDGYFLNFTPQTTSSYIGDEFSIQRTTSPAPTKIGMSNFKHRRCPPLRSRPPSRPRHSPPRHQRPPPRHKRPPPRRHHPPPRHRRPPPHRPPPLRYPPPHPDDFINRYDLCNFDMNWQLNDNFPPFPVIRYGQLQPPYGLEGPPYSHQYLPYDPQYPPYNQQYVPNDQQYLPNGQQYLPKYQQSPPYYQQYPLNGQQYPPYNQQFAPNDQQYPPNYQQYPPYYQQYPPNNQQYPPYYQQYAPNDQSWPSNCQQYPPYNPQESSHHLENLQSEQSASPMPTRSRMQSEVSQSLNPIDVTNQLAGSSVDSLAAIQKGYHDLYGTLKEIDKCVRHILYKLDL